MSGGQPGGGGNASGTLEHPRAQRMGPGLLRLRATPANASFWVSCGLLTFAGRGRVRAGSSRDNSRRGGLSKESVWDENWPGGQVVLWALCRLREPVSFFFWTDVAGASPAAAPGPGDSWAWGRERGRWEEQWSLCLRGGGEAEGGRARGREGERRGRESERVKRVKEGATRRRFRMRKMKRRR